MTNMMKYYFGLIILLTIYSCNRPEGNTIPSEKALTKIESIGYPDNYSKVEFVDSNGLKTVHIDSLHYKIRWRYHNEHFKIKHIIDTLIKIDSFYTFSNDSLIGYGLRTYPNNSSIGKWKIKTENYQDSIVDHDKKWNCNYFDALKIAEKSGFMLPNIEVIEGAYFTSKGYLRGWNFEKINHQDTLDRNEPHFISISFKTGEYTLYNRDKKQLFP